MMIKSGYRDELRHTIRTVALGTGLRLLRWPIVLLSVIFIPRIMQEEMYGRYALFVTVYLLADALTDLGILHIFGRFVPEASTAEQEKQRSLLVQGLLIIGVLFAGFMGLIFALGALLLPAGNIPLTWVTPFFLLLIFTRIDGVLFSFLYGLNHIARYSSRDVLRSLMQFAGVVFFYIHYGLIGAIWSLVFKEILLTLLAIYWTRHYLFRRVHIHWAKLKEYVLFGCSFYLPMLLFGLLQRSGALFIQAITKSPEQVGYFDIANQFFLMTVSFLGVIMVTLLPAMTAHYNAKNDDIIHRWHGIIMSYCGLAIFLIFNALAWLGEPAITMALGSGFAPVRKLALIMVTAMIPGLIIYVGMNYAVLKKEPFIYTRGVFAAIAVMILVCLLLIPFWQASGAAWAVVAGHSVLAVFFGLRYRSALSTALAGFSKTLAIGCFFLPFFLIDASGAWRVGLFFITSFIYISLIVYFRILDLGLLFWYAKKAWYGILGRRD